MENMSLSDIAAVTKNDDDSFGGNGAWWIIVLFLFMFGSGWNRNTSSSNGEPVTEAGLCNAMNFNNLENAVGRLSDLTQNQTYQLGNSISNLGKEVALGQASLQLQASNSAAALSQQMANSSCETQRSIDNVNYNAAQNTASINANTTAQVQKVLDAIQQDKVDALQSQVNQLQLQSALCGVVRYPNASTYSAGYSPYFNSAGCNCGTTF